MNAKTEKLDKLFDQYKDKTEGSFHNCLWQLLINEARDLTSFMSCFVYVRVGDHQVGIADRYKKGFTPALFQFKDEVSIEERKQILEHLNKEIFMLSAEQAMIIEFSTY